MRVVTVTPSDAALIAEVAAFAVRTFDPAWQCRDAGPPAHVWLRLAETGHVYAAYTAAGRVAAVLGADLAGRVRWFVGEKSQMRAAGDAIDRHAEAEGVELGGPPPSRPEWAQLWTAEQLGRARRKHGRMSREERRRVEGRAP